MTPAAPAPSAMAADTIAPGPAPPPQLPSFAPSQGPPTAAAAPQAPAAGLQIGPPISPAGSPGNASLTLTAAAGSPGTPLNSRQITVIIVAASIIGAALLAAAAVFRCRSSRKAVHDSTAPARQADALADTQSQNGPIWPHGNLTGRSGPLSLPNLPISLRPLQLGPAVRQDKPTVQMWGSALLPTHTSPSVTPTSASRAQPAVTHLDASSTSAGQADWSQAAAVQEPAEKDRQAPLAALQLDAQHESHLLQPTPLTRRWTWQVRLVIPWK